MANQHEPQMRVGVNKVHMWLSDDKKTLHIAYGGRHDLAVELQTEQVDEMLSSIGLWRAQMIPAPTTTYAPVKHVNAINNPCWYTEPELSMGGSLLHVRHPGFGWLSFYIPLPELTKLNGLLHAQVGEPNKPSQTSD